MTVSTLYRQIDEYLTIERMIYQELSHPIENGTVLELIQKRETVAINQSPFEPKVKVRERFK